MTIEQSEKQLIERLLEKDEKALRVVYKRYYSLLLRFITKQINDIHEAEELTQDIFLDFLESLRDFRFQSSLKTYLFSIARHKIIALIRKKKVKKILFSALPEYVVEGLVKIFIEDDLEKKEIEQKIKKTFSKLPHEYELILRLKYIEERPVKKIAEIMSMTFKATESLLFRARKTFVRIFNSTP